MMRKICSILLVGFLFLSYEASAKKLNAGPWLFELRTNNANVPFIVNFKWEGKKLVGEIENGKEKIPLNDIKIENDKIIIPIQTYEITMELSEDNQKNLSGYLIRHNKNPISKHVLTATYGIHDRFPLVKGPAEHKVAGRYSVEILDEEGNKSAGVLVLDQKDTEISGSLLTPTGDYRYFEGYLSGDEFVTASFDGMFNYIIKGHIKNKKIEAALLTNYKLKLSGELNAKASLPDAYKQTQLESLSFFFPDLSGRYISLNDPKFKGKPVIVQFFGSWCPNCLDEMNYLIPWYKENQKRGIEIVALSFERSLDQDQAKIQLKKLQAKKNVPYTLLLAASTAQEKPMEKIKGLKNFISFPTTVFLNKKHEVVKVHAGFTGPGTGEFFEKWKKEFNETVNKLVK